MASKFIITFKNGKRLTVREVGESMVLGFTAGADIATWFFYGEFTVKSQTRLSSCWYSNLRGKRYE